VRKKRGGIASLGLTVHPRPQQGFVRYENCRVSASAELFKALIKPNQTTLIDIVLNRVVHKEMFRLERTLKQGSFKRVKPGDSTVS
jgi:hypothetical protein